MKQMIPFHKEIVFRTMIGEITSISLEHTLKVSEEHNITGDFIVSGTYKMTEASQIEEKFDYHIPVDIAIAPHYDLSDSKVTIDDFYYEVINDEVLKVNIDVLLDGLKDTLEIQEQEDSKLEREENDLSTMDSTPFDISLDEEVIRSHIEKTEEGDLMEENEIPILETEIVESMMDQPKEVESIAAPVKQEKEIEVKTNHSVVSEENIGSIFSAFKDTDETFSTYSVYIVREGDTLDAILERYKTPREELANYNNLDELTVGTKLIIPSTLSNES